MYSLAKNKLRLQKSKADNMTKKILACGPAYSVIIITIKLVRLHMCPEIRITQLIQCIYIHKYARSVCTGLDCRAVLASY